MSSVVTSDSIISNTLKHREYLPLQCANSEMSGISESQELEIALNEDIDYQGSHATTMNSATSVQPTGLLRFPVSMSCNRQRHYLSTDNNNSKLC